MASKKQFLCKEDNNNNNNDNNNKNNSDNISKVIHMFH